jgi:hypothetical protein
MKHYSLAVAAVVLVGSAGAALAELNDPPPLESAKATAASVQPAPPSRVARPPVASRRIQSGHTQSITLIPPSCGDWLSCGRYVIGGMDF